MVAGDSLRVNPGGVEMLRGEAVVASARWVDLLGLRWVRFANGLFHGEERFVVGVFGPQTWVVPEFTPGFDEFWRECVAVRGFEEATVETIPWAWRQRVFGFVPLFPVPRLCAFATEGAHV